MARRPDTAPKAEKSIKMILETLAMRNDRFIDAVLEVTRK